MNVDGVVSFNSFAAHVPAPGTLTTHAAIEREHMAEAEDPRAAADWDRVAEQRWAHYHRTSPFAVSEHVSRQYARHQAI